MAAAGDLEGDAGLDHRPAIALLDREFGMGGRDVEYGQGGGGALDGFGAGRGLADQIVEQGQLERQRLVACLADPRLDLAELDRGEAHGIRHGLAMDEEPARPGIELAGMGRRHLDVVAQHVVVPDLQAGNAGRLGVARLEIGHHAPALVAQLAPFVEIEGIARGNEAAIAGEERQLGRQRPG